MPLKSQEKQAVNEFFSNNSMYWKLIYQQDNNLTNQLYQISQRKRTILRFIDGLAGNGRFHILDVGCGAGELLGEMKKRGHHTVGMDLSREMVLAAREQTAGVPAENSGFTQGDIEAIPFADNLFDVVTCVGVLSYLKSEHRALEEMKRVLRPDGILVITLPNILRVNNLLDPYYFLTRVSKYTIRGFAGNGKNRVKSRNRNNGNSIYVRKYFYNQLGRLFRSKGFFKISTAGLGFGPLTFGGREIMIGSGPISLSNRLEKLSGIKILRFLNLFANHWVIYLANRVGDKNHISDCRQNPITIEETQST